MERPSIGYLIEVLKERNRDNNYIIEVLRSIIQQKVMYGGDIQDLINYQIEQAKNIIK